MLASLCAIQGDLNAGSSGWIDWNVLLDASGGPNHLGNLCDAPMIADASLERVHLHPQYWFLGHFSKFVPPGSVRIQLDKTGGADDLSQPRRGKVGDEGAYNFSSASVAYGRCTTEGPQAVGFKRQDGRLVVVILNCDNAERVVRLQFRPGVDFDRVVPPHAIQTYIIKT